MEISKRRESIGVLVIPPVSVIESASSNRSFPPPTTRSRRTNHTVRRPANQLIEI